ncbi:MULTISPECIES: VTT domain-containing protein [unclassified Leifsonia]|uniref:DedA family protein n=1 Tax=unclassified Leifsonia TaxID=2663824 RepID=UPI0008A7FE81|nr:MULTISPECIES: VTT domain-containing protein [unclassified Leifsonia]SEH75964.1 membrane-associated protein [Leifsonia sp. CL154]SFL37506.1 membrane-associated protein [Leifsonia sp. CL147]
MIHHAGLIPWLDPNTIIHSAGPWALLVVCGIVFAETGLLIGFLFPGDTLLIISGLLTHTSTVFGVDIWWVALAIAFAAFLGGEVGYLIGHKAGPRVFERKETGLFSMENVRRTNHFFERFGALAVIIARFVPIVRTFAPVAAGVGHMNYRKYSLYNALGALLWGAGMTYFGFLIGYIPPVATFVSSYIDVILIGAVVVTLVPTLYHYIQSTRKAKRNAAAEAAAAEAASTQDEAAAPVTDEPAPSRPEA